MRLLIKYPTRSRQQKALETLRKYIEYAKDISKIKFLVSLDSDDRSSNPDEFRRLHPNVEVIVGNPCGKIGAVNRDMPDPSTFDILLLASDDMVPEVPFYDEQIRERMSQFYPDTDGVLFFNDGYQGYRLNTLVICGSKYYQRFGYIYYPGYKSLFCDNEFMDVANELGKQTYFDQVIIRHQHFTNTRSSPDALYTHNDTFWNHDHNVYYSRVKYKYDVSLLICTIPTRQEIFSTLLEEIEVYKKQVSIKVQVLFDMRTDISVGQKRNDLITRASGKYSCFVDDDDKITSDYLKVLEDAINTGNDYDSIAFNGRYYIQGLYVKPFHHSLRYKNWFEDEKGYYRNPNHLNPMKTHILRKLLFKNVSFEEDLDFATRLQNTSLIKTEYSHNKIQYLYYCKNVDVDYFKRTDGKFYYNFVKRIPNQVINHQRSLPGVGVRRKNGRFSLT